MGNYDSDESSLWADSISQALEELTSFKDEGKCRMSVRISDNILF